jgi:hypothetical protein
MLRLVPLLVFVAACGPTATALRADSTRCHVWMANAVGDQAGTRVVVEDGAAVWERDFGIRVKSSFLSSPTRIAVNNGLTTVEYATVDASGLSFDLWRNGDHVTFDGGTAHGPPGRMDIPAFYYNNVCSARDAALGVAEMLRAASQSVASPHY